MLKEGDKYDECTKFQYQVVLKPQNLTELSDTALTELPDTALTLACGRINEEEEEEVQRAEEVEEEADNVKTIIELFNKAYI